MNLSRAFRRTAALAGAALVTTAAALAVASPAQAHHGTVSGTAVCVDGGYKVTWKVTNSQNNLKAKIKQVVLTPAPTTVTNITVGAWVPLNKDGSLTGTQFVPAGNDVAKLSVKLKWDYDKREDVYDWASATVVLTAICPTPTPTVTVAPTTPAPT
ncbi:MAG TPA: hypothetical protein VNV66_13105, partial [Pilimelia sp.]|nr:hypothetical protein [Pilimelia sp.]